MYEKFFSSALGDDKIPFAYQSALATRDWPDALIAPTGLGKTAAVILGWAWKHVTRQKAPKRLVYCLPMRTLVEQTEQNAKHWMKQLREANKEWSQYLPDPDKDIHVLMGGAGEPEWFKNPEQLTILIGTQDMLLSRALMRGYAMSRFRWPVDFALLHNDAQWVFDEVQLMGAGLPTSAQLEGFRNKWGAHIPSASIWTSATLCPSWLQTIDFQRKPTVWKVPEQFSEDEKSNRVLNLINAAKPIQKSEISPASANKPDMQRYMTSIAEEIASIHIENQLTLVIVNTVARAQGIFNALRKQYKFEENRLALIHSRFRPADRKLQMEKLPKPGEQKDLIVISTQAIEAGVDISASVLLTELAPAASLVQRFGRVNRYGELNSKGGGLIHWIDITGASTDKRTLESLSMPYKFEEIEQGKNYLLQLSDARPSLLAQPETSSNSHHSVIRSKDMIDLFDTDPDMSGFDVDVSTYIRDSVDTDIRVFWRDFDRNNLQEESESEPLPQQNELCAIPIGSAKTWLNSVRKKDKFSVYQLNPPARRTSAPWIRLTDDPWPGILLMVKTSSGGYSSATGFDPQLNQPVESIYDMSNKSSASDTSIEAEPDSKTVFVNLNDHLKHVASEAKLLCDELGINNNYRDQIIDASAWHDLGKAHEEFQSRLVTNDPDENPRPDVLLAKAPKYNQRTEQNRRYFRHELASALAYLSQNNWSREADLVAYMIAAHHGKVRMNIQTLPFEISNPQKLENRRIARGLIEGDILPTLDLPHGKTWVEKSLTLSIMELGEHPETGASWTARTQSLLIRFGPFQLAWMEALVRIADWRASRNEELGVYE